MVVVGRVGWGGVLLCEWVGAWGGISIETDEQIDR